MLFILLVFNWRNTINNNRYMKKCLTMFVYENNYFSIYVLELILQIVKYKIIRLELVLIILYKKMK